jgi:hypothetical protein
MATAVNPVHAANRLLLTASEPDEFPRISSLLLILSAGFQSRPF